MVEEKYLPMHNIESKIVLFRKGRELLSSVLKEAMQRIDKRRKRSRLSRNARHAEHRKRYAEWVAKNVIYVSQWKVDPETGESVIDLDAPKVRLDLRNALVSWTNDGLKVGMVLGKKSTAINSTYGNTVIYCDGKEVMGFDMFSDPPRKSFGEKVARQMEAKLGLVDGYFDRQIGHGNQPGTAAENAAIYVLWPPVVTQIAEIARDLPDAMQNQLLGQAKMLQSEHRVTQANPALRTGQ